MEQISVVSDERSFLRNDQNFSTEDPPKWFHGVAYFSFCTFSIISTVMAVYSIKATYCNDLNIPKEHVQLIARALAISGTVLSLISISYPSAFILLKLRPTPGEKKFHHIFGGITIAFGVVGLVPNIYGIFASYLRVGC